MNKNLQNIIRKLAAAACFILFTLALCEGAARGYLRVKDGIPFFAPASRHLYRYYPGLKEVEDAKPAGAGDVEILMLGASSLKNPLYDVGAVVEKMLGADPALAGRKVKVFNLAVEAQTSLDSYYKYLAIAGKRNFAAVVVYDGINDLRANNCPPEMFRADYSHYAWYDDVDFYHRNEGYFRAGLYFPFFTHAAGRRLRARFSKTVYVPRERPRREWYKYGPDIKTAGPFRKNINGILRIAAANKQKVILATFAHYIPEGYSYQNWLRKKYGRNFVFPVEMWGTPAAVEKGLAAHNAIIREEAAADPAAAVLLDEDKTFPARDDMFIDVCHMTPNGAARLSWDISRKIAGAVAKRR